MKRYIGLMMLCLGATGALAQNTGGDMRMGDPFDFPMKLSANFGELRNNHFHGGIDIKTDGRIGKEIYSPADGYVARISISHTGYGLALYICHPNGYTTVYGHLSAYNARLQKFVNDYQYRNETFSMDVDFAPTDFPVRKGELVAYSGNTGASLGPHLHYEIRDSRTDEFTDPMAVMKNRFFDTKAPKASSIRVYPMAGKGVLDGESSSHTYAILQSAGADNCLKDTLRVWGSIGFGIRANDYMDGVSNIFGVRKLQLLADGVELFRSDLDRFSSNDNRMIYAWTDVEETKLFNRWFMRSYLLPGNTLRFMTADQNRGVLQVNEPRCYRMEYVLTDFYGNVSRYPFLVKGEPQEIPVAEAPRKVLRWNQVNIIQEPGFELDIPKGNLYDDLPVYTYVTGDSSGIANSYRLYHYAYPLHNYCPISIRIRRDVMTDKSKYYMVNLVGGGVVGGTYENGWMKGKVRELGTYTVRVDTVAPRIVPIDKNGWTRTGNIQLKISDSGSGIKRFKGTIDGKFALFTSSPSRLLTCKWKELPFTLDGVHNLQMEVEDMCGNKSYFTETFNTKVIQPKRKVRPRGAARPKARAKAKPRRRR